MRCLWSGFIKPGSIPKTSSGKIQRRACRADFLEVRGNSILDSSDSAADENSLSRENLLATPAERRPLEAYLQQQPRC